MHEAALARQILSALLERAELAPGERIRRARGWVAETEALSRQSLELQFAAHARGTPAEGAELELALIHVEAQCRACGARYAPDHHVLLCPACGSSDGETLGPVGLGIDTLEVG